MARTASTRKTAPATKKSVKAAGSPKAPKAKKTAATKKITAPKKAAKKAAYLPLKGSTYVFVDFKDNDMEAKIVDLGGKMTRSLKTAHILVCEDLWGDKAMDAMNKYNRLDDGQSKDDVLSNIEELTEMGSKPIPTLEVGKKSIVVLSEWFTEKGSPVRTSQLSAEMAVVFEDAEGNFPYDCCFHEDGNVSDMYTRLSRLQLLQEVGTDKYTVIRVFSFLEDLATSSNSITMQIGRYNNLAEAATSFQNDFREEVGYTWKNRATCKPKKGSALVVDLDTLHAS
jgi:hypothetical protein